MEIIQKLCFRFVAPDIMIKSVKLRKTSNPAIKYLHFEDLIFRYDETKKEIFEFLGLNQEHHKQARKYFDPDVSGRNTQLFRNESVNTEEIKKIEEQLTKYLYHFPETDHEYSKGDIF